MESTTDSKASTIPVRPKHRALWLLLAIPVALAGVFAFKAHAMGGGFGFAAGPEMRKAFMEHRLEKALDLVKATDSQRSSIKAIFAAMFTQMRPIHQQHKQLHDGITAAFAADTVDPAAVENLRVQATALIDQSSKIFTKALVDAAAVLTPQQRQTLIAHLQEMHGHGHHHGMQE